MRIGYSTFAIKLLIIFSSLLFVTQVSAQNCGCTHTITTPTGGITFDGNAVTPKVKPGDVLCFQAGTRGRIIMKNIVGTATNPVIIKKLWRTSNHCGKSGYRSKFESHFNDGL